MNAPLDLVDLSGPKTIPLTTLAGVYKPLPHVPLTAVEQILEIIDSGTTFDTSVFLRDIVNIAVVTDDPQRFLKEIYVDKITHRKESPFGYQHELLIIELRYSGPPVNLLLGRTASPDRLPTPSYFTSHSDSDTVLQSVVQALKTTPSSYERIDEPESHTPKLSILDTASLKAARLLSGSSMSSPSMIYRADDRFLGSKLYNADYINKTRNICEIRPASLSIFDFAVLADAVHNHDPLYSIFKSQCYWYAKTICDIIKKEYTCAVVSGPEEPLIVDGVSIPENDYLPDMSGRCMGILISAVEDTVTSIITSNFKEYLREKHDQVRFFFFLLILISIC